MTRRPFLLSLLAAPLAALGWKRAKPEYPGYGIKGLTDDGTTHTAIYQDRMWFTNRDGVHVYYSEAPKS